MNQVLTSDIKRGIASQLMRLFTRSGYWLKRKDDTSNRKRVEVTSARKTRIHGDVVTSQQAYQPKVLQRSPTKTVVNETRNPLLWVRVSVARITPNPVTKEFKR